MNCISCGIPTVKYTENSYLELPTFQCKKCGLYVTGESESEIIEKTTEIYQKKHWGKGNLWDAKEGIKTNYNDIESQGKRRTWISQFKYCESNLQGKNKILEIGSGQGQTCWWFEEKGFNVTGIEPDENNVKNINQKLEKGKCIVGSAEDFQINETFDIVWMSHVFEHIIKPETFLKKIKKNLKENSIFFIEVPNCENESTLETSINLVPHTFHFSQESLKNLVLKSGYEIIKTDYFRPATKLEGMIQKISNKFPYYPRIKTNNRDGIFLRVLLRKQV
jgi:2-polyprenyl-3-methyl-5-hydroxy-6-metoxy-1,4-benzoquinol methylase